MKKLATFNIDSETLENFKQKARRDSINMSLFVENRMKDFLEGTTVASKQG